MWFFDVIGIGIAVRIWVVNLRDTCYLSVFIVSWIALGTVGSICGASCWLTLSLSCAYFKGLESLWVRLWAKFEIYINLWGDFWRLREGTG